MPPPPELACAVLSLGADPRLVDAVRSLRSQDERVEVVVVNSGGGDPEALLADAGLDVSVADEPKPLFAGAARNRGIDATTAPYLAFLAADCRAQPGWASARLERHRAGAVAVAGVMANARPDSRCAAAAMLLTHHRRLAHTPRQRRQFYSLSYDRRLFARHGRFREEIRTGEDTDFNLRVTRGGDEVVWSSAAAAHEYPTAVAEFVRDQFERGRRRAVAYAELDDRKSLRLAGRALINLPRCYRMARAAPDPAERRALTRAWPLLPAGTLAIAIGAASHLLSPGSSGEPRALPWQHQT